MGNHDDFDLDVRLGNGRSSMLSQPQGDDIRDAAPINADDTGGETCANTCGISCGGTCDNANTCREHDTCYTCGGLNTCNNTCDSCVQCIVPTGDTCECETFDRTCDTCHGNATCIPNCPPDQ